MSPLIDARDIHKTFTTGAKPFVALRGVSLSIQPGEFVAIMGPSGSGKSTLLHLLGGLDRPTAGELTVASQPLHTMDETQLALFRRAHVGFVFQFFNLIANLTVRDNIELPALLAGRVRSVEISSRANALMEALGIITQAAKLPAQLSGGQRQRVAIARALVNRPDILLADEPTGNLDSASGGEVLRLFKQLYAQDQTIVLVTHDPAAAAHAARVVFLHDGQIAGDETGLDAATIAHRLSRTASRPTSDV
jgi:putative ABC transport system ATP-binding protein